MRILSLLSPVPTWLLRTYNYPQGRVTDHRINLTLYNLPNVLDGALDNIIDALITADTAEKLKSGSV